MKCKRKEEIMEVWKFDKVGGTSLSIDCKTWVLELLVKGDLMIIGNKLFLKDTKFNTSYFGEVSEGSCIVRTAYGIIAIPEEVFNREYEWVTE